MNNNKRCAFNSNELQELLKGHWHLGEGDIAPPEVLYIDYFVMGIGQVKFPNTCYVAMSYENWLKGTANSGHYKNIFSDSHVSLVKNYPNLEQKDMLICIIAEHPIPELSGILPQLIVENGYKAVYTLAEAAREKMENNATIIAVTGAVGKSTTVNMLHTLLEDETDYITNIGGNNTRIGVRVCLTSVGRFAPEFNLPNAKSNVCTLEVAESALWESKQGVCSVVRPHIGVITHVSLTQWNRITRSDRDVALVVSKVCNGIVPGGHAVLYRGMPYFDLVKEKVVEYGAIPITYGETEDCDVYVKSCESTFPVAGEDIVNISTKIDAIVLGETVSYEIGEIGKPFVLNSLAALASAKLAGFDLSIAKKLANYKTIKNTLDMINCAGVCILDSSKNGPILSIIAAIDTLKQVKQKPNTRKVIILTRSVNLTEHKSELSLALTDPIRKSTADVIFLHEPTNEFRDLVHTIPSDLIGGKYKNAEDVVEAALGYIREGDSVLIAGSRRASDFGKVIELLQEGIIANKEAGKLSLNNPRVKEDYIVPPQKSSATTFAFSLDKNCIVWQKGNVHEEYPGGLGLPILLYYVLDLVKRKKLSWVDEVTANQYAAKESNHPNSLGLKYLEKIDLLTLFKAAAISSSPDAISALAGHIVAKVGRSKVKTTSSLKKIGKSWGIPNSAIQNVSGRYTGANSQHFTPELLLKTAGHLMAFDVKNILSQKNVSYKDKYFESDSIFESPLITHYFSYTTGLFTNTVCVCENGGEAFLIAVCGAETFLERDSLLLEAMHRASTPLPPPHKGFIQTSKSMLTICGDTYCGERYTKWRISKNIDDPIQKYGDEGYAYSFEKVAPLISKNSFNIVNSECVLSPVYDEEQQTGKYIDFVLGANPQKTINCYKKVNIDAVMLANNHAMDFGAVGCRQTRKYFEDAGLNPIGTGSNIDEAEKPLMLEVNGKQIIVFNAYCLYSKKRHNVFRHYSLGANTGTAFGTDLLDDISLWRRINAYRNEYPNALIIFSPHWSSDFNKHHETLRPIAVKAFDEGVDLILGHGPHIPVGTECINEKLCIYSLGNFVFNATGTDLDSSDHPPYGVVAQLDLLQEDPELKLYPIYAHNLNTFFQPYPVVDEMQLDEFMSSFIGIDEFEIKKDNIGFYLDKNLK